MASLVSVAARDAALRKEALYFHEALYSAPPDATVVEEYVRAHRYFCAASDDNVDIESIISRRMDVEALELALRKRSPVLTRKLRVLIYLTEVKPAYYTHFVNLTGNRFRAWIALFAAAVRFVMKYVKGRMLLRTLRDA